MQNIENQDMDQQNSNSQLQESEVNSSEQTASSEKAPMSTSLVDEHTHKVTYVPITDPSLAAGLMGHSERVLNDLSDNQAVSRRLRAERILQERAGVQILHDVAERKVSFATIGMPDIDPLALLDAPMASQSLMAQQVNAAISVLAKKTIGTRTVDEVHLDGTKHLAMILAHLDYERTQKTVNLPIGNLNAIATAQRDKMTAFLRMILQRINAMATLPLRDVDRILTSIAAVSNQDADAAQKFFESFGIRYDAAEHAVDPVGTLQDALESLDRADRSARERFISQTILQPLYRNVFTTQGEFHGITSQDIMHMASKHNEWKRMIAGGAMASVIQHEVSRTITDDDHVSGLASLRDATILGVKQSAPYAFASLGAVVPNVPECSYSVIAEGQNINGIDIATPFSSLSRRLMLHDLKGDPVVLSDTFTPVSPNDEELTASSISRLISIYAFYSGVEITHNVNLDFITRYPEWNGLIASPGSAFQLDDPQFDVITPWLDRRIRYEFLASVLNADYVDSNVLTTFAAQNGSDLQKVFDTGVQYYALAHATVLRLLAEYLGAIRASFEWSRSVIWEQLDKLGLQIQPVDTLAFKTRYEATKTSAAPLIQRHDTVVKATEYYMDEQAAVHTPVLNKVYQTLRTLGVLGDLSIQAVHSRPISISDLLPVDVIEAIQNPDLPEAVRAELVSNNTLVRAQELNAMAAKLRTDLDLSLFNTKYSSEGILLDGFGYVASMQPAIYISLPSIPRLMQLPKQVIGGPDGDTLTAEDEALMPPMMRRQFVPLDPQFAFQMATVVAPIEVSMSSLVLPQTQEELQSYIRAWAHNTSLIVQQSEE